MHSKRCPGGDVKTAAERFRPNIKASAVKAAELNSIGNAEVIPGRQNEITTINGYVTCAAGDINKKDIHHQ